MGWLIASIIAMLIFGFYPIFGDRAGQIHGEKINFILDSAMMFIMALGMAIMYPGEFSKITKVSLSYGSMLGFSSIGFFFMLYAWRIAPEKIPVITAIICFAAVVTAIIYNFMGTKLNVLEWICIAGATFFISMLCFLQKRV